MAVKRQLDLFTAVEQIVEKAKGSGLSSDFYRKADKYIRYISEKMELTKEQSVMMALFMDNCSDSRITMNDFGEFLECRPTRIIRYMVDIDVLEKRELVRCNRDGRCITYRVPMEVIEAFKNDEQFVPKDNSGLSCLELFGELEDIFDLRDNNELTYDGAVQKIEDLFACNSQLLYVQKVKSYRFSKEDEMMLILFSHLFVNNNDDNILIATTNLANNMDKAFERRFLYKIRFEKPTEEARMSMWKEMIPVLNDDESRILASKYDFSGGQIENIARHYTIGNILHGKSDNIIECLSGYCDSELIETKEQRKIGFVRYGADHRRG